MYGITKDEEGNYVTDPNEIEGMITNFYKSLYTIEKVYQPFVISHVFSDLWEDANIWGNLSDSKILREAPLNMDIILQLQSGKLQRINELHVSYLGLQYPILFSYGEDGYRKEWKKDIPQGSLSLRTRVTCNCLYHVCSCMYYVLSFSNQSVPRCSVPRCETMVISRKQARIPQQLLH